MARKKKNNRVGNFKKDKQQNQQDMEEQIAEGSATIRENSQPREVRPTNPLNFEAIAEEVEEDILGVNDGEDTTGNWFQVGPRGKSTPVINHNELETAQEELLQLTKDDVVGERQVPGVGSNTAVSFGSFLAVSNEEVQNEVEADGSVHPRVDNG